MEQFALIATKCFAGPKVLISFVELLHQHLVTTVTQDSHYLNSQEFFQLFSRLLKSATVTRCPLPQAKDLLTNEISLLRNVRVGWRIYKPKVAALFTMLSKLIAQCR